MKLMDIINEMKIKVLSGHLTALDKKVVKRNSEASLIIEKDMTLEDELVEYLNYILQIPEDQVFNILRTYNDYAQKAQVE